MTASPKSPLRSQAPGGTVRDSLASGIRTIDRQRGLGHEGCFGQAGPLRDLYEGLYRARARPGEFNSLDAQYCPAADQRSLNYRGAKRGTTAASAAGLEVLIPILYLKGVSTGDFEEALLALLGKDAGGLSASTVGRLKDAWSDEHARWSRRELSAKRYVYFWADGIHVQARLEDAAQCLLLIIAATPEGKKELVGLIDGVRESAQSWRELLVDLKRTGLAIA